MQPRQTGNVVRMTWHDVFWGILMKTLLMPRRFLFADGLWDVLVVSLGMRTTGDRIGWIRSAMLLVLFMVIHVVGNPHVF